MGWRRLDLGHVIKIRFNVTLAERRVGAMLRHVRAQFSLTALVYNLRRALNILGVEAMMAAARG